MSAALSLPTERVVTIGDNNPPESTPFDVAKNTVDEVFGEAKHWLDGATVSSQAEADAIGILLDMARKAEKLADDTRKAEKKPHDDAGKAVQARYKPILDRVALITSTCKDALTPWLREQDRIKREAAEKARQEAERKAAEAQAAIRAAADLEAKERAEAMLRDAKAADKAATKAEGSRATATGGARAVSLRTSYRAEVTDLREYARALWQEQNNEFVEFLHTLAQRQIDAGRRGIPGVTVHTETRAV